MRGVLRRSIIKEIFVKAWWVYAFCLICFLGYSHFANKRRKDIESLQMRLTLLQKQIDDSYQIKEELYQQIHSQSDPQWIELVLMKQLGVVPKGYLKIHFKKE